MYDIITVGRRLRTIRKHLGIRQEEITGDVVTRNLISIIENDKANLTRKVAEVVVDQINRHPKAMAVGFTITVEDMLESPEDQIRVITEKWLKDIQEGKVDIREEVYRNGIYEIQALINQYDLFELSFELNVLCESQVEKDFFAALDYALMAYEKSHRMVKSTKVSNLIIRIGYYCIMIGRYQDALYYFKILENTYPKMSNDDRFIVYYNKALALARLKRFEESVAVIDKILEFKNVKNSDIEQALLSKASSFVDLGRHEDAIRIYKYLLRSVTEDKNKCLIISSMINAYTILGYTEPLKTQLESGIEFLGTIEADLDIPYTSNLLYRIAKAYEFLKQNDKYLEYLERSFNRALTDNRKAAILLAIDDLIAYHLGQADKQAIKELKKKTMELHGLGLIEKSDSTVWLLLEALSKLGQNKDLLDVVKTIKA